jgi:hypothetical protein
LFVNSHFGLVTREPCIADVSHPESAIDSLPVDGTVSGDSFVYGITDMLRRRSSEARLLSENVLCTAARRKSVRIERWYVDYVPPQLEMEKAFVR